MKIECLVSLKLNASFTDNTNWYHLRDSIHLLGAIDEVLGRSVQQEIQHIGISGRIAAKLLGQLFRFIQRLLRRVVRPWRQWRAAHTNGPREQV